MGLMTSIENDTLRAWLRKIDDWTEELDVGQARKMDGWKIVLNEDGSGEIVLLLVANESSPLARISASMNPLEKRIEFFDFSDLEQKIRRVRRIAPPAHPELG